MYNADPRSKKFIDGLHYFLDVAEENKRNGFMCCLCIHCQNKKDYSSSRTLHSHSFANGFMFNYICWTSPWEKGLIMEDNEEKVFVGNFSSHAGFGAFDDVAAMEEPEGEAADEDPIDNLGQALRDAREDCGSENERMKFQQMLADHHKLLYPGCADGLKKLGITLELLQWKATHGGSDKGFGELLKL
jgi:hypothetical protein